MRSTVRAALVTLGVAAGCLLAPVAPPTVAAAPAAPAAPAAACPDQTGVTVVVDFGATGGGRHVRCVAGDPSSGLEALGAAGFSYSFVPNKGPFVCTIDRRPDPCNGAPADAYWSYWSASRGGSWSYSNVGAHQRNPEPGSVEGWSFGAGSAPGVAPPSPAPAPAPVAPPPPPPPTTRAPAPPPPTVASPGTSSTEAPPPPAENDAAPRTETSAPTSTESEVEGPDRSSSTTTTEVSTTTTERSADGDDGRATALEAENTASSSGSGAGALVALAVAVAIAGSAVWEVRRRRSPS